MGAVFGGLFGLLFAFLSVGTWIGIALLASAIGLAAMSDRPRRVTGGCWPAMVSSAFGPHFSVVEMIIRRVNPPLPEAARKESMSGFCTVCADS